MTPNPDQFHAAFDHALAAADLDATAPSGLGEPVARPLALDLQRQRASAARRRPALVAAIVVAVAGLAVCGAIVASGRSDNETRFALAAPTGPVVAVGLDAPDLVLVDSSGAEDLGPQHARDRVPRAHLAVFRSSTGATLAVADRAEDGDGSLDRFAQILDVSSKVASVDVRSRSDEARELTNGLDASTWVAGGRHVTVASRGLTPAEHDSQVEVLVSASVTGTLRAVEPVGFSLQYAGPDDNPFYSQPAPTIANYRTNGGTAVSVARDDVIIDAAQLARYAWYRTAAPTEIDGHPALRVNGDNGTATLFLATRDGLVELHARAKDVERYADDVVPLDAAGWANLRATATEPGSIHASADATTQPP